MGAQAGGMYSNKKQGYGMYARGPLIVYTRAEAPWDQCGRWHASRAQGLPCVIKAQILTTKKHGG